MRTQSSSCRPLDGAFFWIQIPEQRSADDAAEAADADDTADEQMSR